MSRVSLPPELVNQSEANMLALLRCDETRNLRFLSEGLVTILDSCNPIFLDTSVLLNGTFTFRNTTQWMWDYANKRGEFNLHSVSTIHNAYERASDKRIDIDELYDRIAEDILCGDLSLKVFEEAFQCRNIMLSRQVFEEASRNYSLARRQVAFEEGRTDYLYRCRPSKSGFRNRKARRDKDIRIRSERELILKRIGRVDPYIIRCIKDNLKRLSGILSFAQSNDRITDDSGIFPEDAQYFDHIKINGAMQYPVTTKTPYPVGIVTHDGRFEGKAREVIAERIYRRLDVPQVYILTGFRNLETYKRLRIA